MNNYSPFRMWCQKVLPLIYDDSLSYYEVLCKLVKWLKDMIDDLESQHSDIEDLKNKFNELKTYVDNYFNNLNIQTEINNKLDQMATDGTFDSLINKYIFSDNLNYGYRVIYSKPENLNNYNKDGCGCQGFDVSGDNMAIIYHAGDDVPAYLRISKLSDGAEIFNGIITKDEKPALGHWNSLCWYGNYLYCVRTPNLISVLDLTGKVINEYSVTSNTSFWLHDLLNKSNYADMVLNITEIGGYSGFIVGLGYKGYSINTYTQIPTELGMYTRNGCSSNGYIVAQNCYNFKSFNIKNKIMIYSINGFHIVDYYFTNEWDKTEIEAVHLSEDGSYMYVSTLGGNVYKLLTPEIKKYMDETAVSMFGHNVAFNNCVLYESSRIPYKAEKITNNITKEFYILPRPDTTIITAQMEVSDGLRENYPANAYTGTIVIDKALPKGSTQTLRYIRAVYTKNDVDGVPTYRLTGIQTLDFSGTEVKQFGTFDNPVSDDTLNSISIGGLKIKPELITCVCPRPNPIANVNIL